MRSANDEPNNSAANNGKSGTIMGIGPASRVESYRSLKVSFMRFSFHGPIRVRNVYMHARVCVCVCLAYLRAVIMQGYQNVRAVCSAHYETVAWPAGAFGARGKHASALSISQCVRSYGEAREFLWREFQLWPLAQEGRQSVKPYFHLTRETPLIAPRVFPRECERCQVHPRYRSRDCTRGK